MGIYNTNPFLINEYKNINKKHGTKFFQSKNKIFDCEHYFYQNKTLKNGNDPILLYNKLIKGEDSDFIVNKFDEFLEKEIINKYRNIYNSPFFATLWFHAPHAPFISTPKFKQMAIKLAKQDSLGIDDDGNEIYLCGELFEENHRKQGNRKSCRQVFNNRKCYEYCFSVKVEFYASILAFDNAIKNTFDILKKYKFNDNTFVMLLSDNGPARFDATKLGSRYIGPGSTSSLPGYKGEIREGGLRVPSFVYFPLLINNNKNILKTPYTNVDILPTLIELSNNPLLYSNIIHNLDGISFLSEIRGFNLERNKPIGYVDENSKQLLIFHNYTLNKNDVGVSSVKFFHINDISEENNKKAESIILQMSSKNVKNNEYISSFNSWAKSYRSRSCVKI